ncbi:hypothetical protein ANO11243_057300 [Dothideomycetidae sp. 11243]|nr:hypothetical protein ANO11243_057300 [fungal sp. No.11243]
MQNAVCLTYSLLRVIRSPRLANTVRLDLQQQCRSITRWNSPRHSLSICRFTSSPSRSCTASSTHDWRRTLSCSTAFKKDEKSRKGKSGRKSLATTNQEQPQLTWRDYDPAELAKIFGSTIDEETGNWIVRLMNWRRKSGSLIDQGIDFEASLGISREQAYAALGHLRQHEPDFDESQAGIAWAEEQIQELTAPYVARAEKLGLYKRIDTDESEQAESSDVYGESQLIAMKRTNEARFQEEERLRIEKEKQEEDAALAAAKEASASRSNSSSANSTSKSSDETTLSTGGASSRASLARRDRAAWVKHYEERAVLSHDTVAPEMSVLSRLGPAFLVTLTVLAFSLLLHENYVSPPDSARMYPDIPASTATLGALIGLQVLVAIGYRFPPFWRAYNKYFIVVPAAPRAVSVLLATFTHQQFSHLFWNAVLLFSFGQYLHNDTSRGSLLAIFLATGTAANFAALSAHVLRRNFAVYSYGASTAVYGVVSATCLLRADHDVSLFGYKLPMTGLVLLAALALLDGLAFVRGGAVAKAINFEGHLAGFLAGGLCAAGIRWEEGSRARLQTWTPVGEEQTEPGTGA